MNVVFKSQKNPSNFIRYKNRLPRNIVFGMIDATLPIMVRLIGTLKQGLNNKNKMLLEIKVY